MITQKNADARVVVRSDAYRLALTYVEVSDSARELEQNHLCGPTAGLIQSEALAGVALLGQELSDPDETITFRLDVDGPIGGFLMEANGKGDLRGYTRVKVLNEFDGLDEPDISQALGEHGTVEIIRSKPGLLEDCARAEVNPPSVARALEQYYGASLQRQVAIRLATLDANNYICTARGLLLECMPDGDKGRFDRAKAYFEDSTILSFLEENIPLSEICKLLGMDKPVYSEPMPLRFACHCSVKRVEAMLACLSIPELTAMIEEGNPAQIYCHLCGKGYSIGIDRLKALRESLKHK